EALSRDVAEANRSSGGCGSGVGRDDHAVPAGAHAKAPARRRLSPVFGWALAASVALAAVFGLRQAGPDLGTPDPLPTSDQHLVADAPAAKPLFSGSFERGTSRPAESIFDSSFGS